MANALDRPEKESYLFVTIRHGSDDDLQFEYYTDWGQDTLGFVSTPGMEVDLPENTGVFDQRRAKILLPKDDFTSEVSNGLPFSPMFIRIEELTGGLQAGDSGSRRVIFNGRVVETVQNHQGRNGTVLFEALTPKARLDIRMGLPATHHCVWTLFGRGCGLNQASHQESGTIDAIDGKEITVTTADIINKTGKFWHRGRLELDGIRISIQDWSDADPTKFYLTRRVPDHWLTEGGILFVPGCDKTIETCRARWSNEERFCGLGYAIPPHNPLFEKGSS